MFNLFRRKRVSALEKELLIAIFNALGEEYTTYARQVEAGLLNRVFFQSEPFKNYVGFSYNPAIVNDYEDRKGPAFKLMGIKVFENTLARFTEVRIYITCGLIVGYSTPEIEKPELDPSKLHLQGVVKQFFENTDYDTISKILDQSVLDLINPSDVYEVKLIGKSFYHIKDLEDGDFIGMDLEKNVFKITHDPFEIIELKEPINHVLSE